MRAFADIAAGLEDEHGVKLLESLNESAAHVLATEDGQRLLRALFVIVRPTQNSFIVADGNTLEAAAHARASELVMLLYANSPSPNPIS